MTVQGLHVSPRPPPGRLALRLAVLGGLAAAMVGSGGPGSSASPVVLAALLLGTRVWRQHGSYAPAALGLVTHGSGPSRRPGGLVSLAGGAVGAWRSALGVAAVAVVVAISGGAAAWAADDPDDQTVTGAEASAVKAAAVAQVGGRAGEVQRDLDDGAAHEVEVTRPDGSTVEVRLDADYAVVGIEGDSDWADGGEE